MYNENMNEEQNNMAGNMSAGEGQTPVNNTDDNVNAGAANQDMAGNASNGAGSTENHEYRYGRSYYQNQQDSVYHTGNQSYQNQNTWNTSGGQNYYNQSAGSNYYAGQEQNTPAPKKKFHSGFWKKFGKVAACVAVVAAVGAGSAFGTICIMDSRDNNSTKTNIGTTQDSKKNTTSVETSTVSAGTAVVTDVSDVVSNVMPSVVSITNVGTQTYSSFFGQTGTYEAESNGSGIIIGQTEEELLVVTNQHVVAGADTLSVIFIDEEACEANVKGTDADKDLAVIAVPLDSIGEETLQKIKVATLGDSDLLNVGEPAIAIGNALGYGQSVTLGVISAKDREVTTENNTNKLIQTDAAINPGNSGGALLNMAGEVIGINSVKYSSTEVEGMGYAIPITDATPIINELMNKETKTKVDDAEKSYLGITGIDITSDVAQSYNMPKGVYVTQVVKDSPAEEAGLEKGDIITKIADVSVTSFDGLKAELEYHAAGTTIEVEIQTPAEGSYGYETKTVQVTLAKQSDK